MNSKLYRFLRWCPGAVGLLLRQKLYPSMFRECGRKVLFGRYVDISRPGAMDIGEGVVIGNHVRLDGKGYGGTGAAISLGQGVFVGEWSLLQAEQGAVRIGEGSSLGSFCRLTGRGELIVGRKVLFAAYCRVGGGEDPNQSGAVPASHHASPVTHIEDDCWLGVRSVVRPGSHIGRGVIVGAHAKVENDIPPLAIAVGRPAVILRMRSGENSSPPSKGADK